LGSHGAGLWAQVKQGDQSPSREEEGGAHDQHAKIAGPHETLGVVDRLPCLASPHTLADDGNDGQSQGHAGHIDDPGHTVGDGVGGHGGSAEGGNQVEDHQLACLKHAVFHTVRDADK